MPSVRPFRLLVLALILAALAALAAYRSWVDAQARALVVLSTALEAPVLTWGVKVVTGEPRAEEVSLAGNASTVVRPGGDGPWPAVLFVNGATPLGRTHPDVQRLVRGLARAGYLAAVPELPGLRRGEITRRTRAAAVAAASAFAARRDARGGRLALVGVSVGTTLALLAAEDPALARRVTVVAGFAPFTDMRQAVLLGTTGYYDAGRLVRYPPDPFLGLAVGRSLAAALASGPDRRRLVAALAPVDDEAPDPLAVVRRRSWRGLGPEARAVVRVLANRDPERFARLYSALPGRIRRTVRSLSPIAQARRLRAPVELATAPRDDYFPVAESRALARAAPDARVTVTRTLAHAIPEPSVRDVSHLLRLNAFVVRALKRARE